MHCETEFYLASLERKILREMYRLFPSQMVGSPTAYHRFPNGQLLRYKVYRFQDVDPDVAYQGLVAMMEELQKQYPDSTLYWRRFPEFTHEPDFEKDEKLYRTSLRIAIDHPDWKNEADPHYV